jgi:hypothetical protein
MSQKFFGNLGHPTAHEYLLTSSCSRTFAQEYFLASIFSQAFNHEHFLTSTCSRASAHKQLLTCSVWALTSQSLLTAPFYDWYSLVKKILNEFFWKTLKFHEPFQNSTSDSNIPRAIPRAIPREDSKNNSTSYSKSDSTNNSRCVPRAILRGFHEDSRSKFGNVSFVKNWPKLQEKFVILVSLTRIVVILHQKMCKNSRFLKFLSISVKFWK